MKRALVELLTWLVSFSWAYAFMYQWNWFIAPLGVVQIHYFHALALMFMVKWLSLPNALSTCMLIAVFSEKDEEDVSALANFTSVISNCISFVVSWISLGISWLIHTYGM